MPIVRFATVYLLTRDTPAHAHSKLTSPDVFKNTVIGGVKTGDWVNVRKTTNFQSNGPVTDVTSAAMTCYQLAAGSESAETVNVTAGQTVGYVATTSITHPGPLSFWMAKAPEGQAASSITGAGPVWFKIFQDYPTVSSGGMTWPSQGKTTVDVTIPKCIPSGDYLLRVEHIGLHSASAVGGAQLYISCAQLTVSGGSGSVPTALESIPGAYKPTDKGLVVNIYYPVPKDYKPPGPDPLKC